MKYTLRSMKRLLRKHKMAKRANSKAFCIILRPPNMSPTYVLYVIKWKTFLSLGIEKLVFTK